ncbi:MAG: NAD(+) synthase [Candidatus Pacebacteria bacterium RIFOXYB1_FULL_39_46]|nr:MAG: NAD(+) synthase [Candidatus Pacebacteria bacterium RIFOXYA1_FULL_38_18]OGJ38448.1 MAG: NAD(+) synthase [Candidatus Pacebacteria bacterium RIFOXYB1_FULL_39_46]OGJ40308.1 MAG: NAD(+) synthase [Candidatus Pacebacteria bacterium RIFOXYC1_FULL_39_21]OGJ40881.1 MAG: NAD(+) synthase [Candidatus Pacebacteria bacterium RIFOXYD1_FULL_39_27]
MTDLHLKNIEQTKTQIIKFIKTTYARANKQTAVIAVSGGIDSAVSLTLLAEALGSNQVFPVFLPYHEQDMTDAKEIVLWNKIPEANWREIPIGNSVDQLAHNLLIDADDQIRLGNVMARVRMIAVFDLAKKINALVCGTENKSEYYLGYFTRFGDEAADIEPLLSLYKTQVRQLAKHLKLPAQFLHKAPSADLWTGQTDEQELGFFYKDADLILEQLVDQKKQLSEVGDVDSRIVQQVAERMEKMAFKHQVPYVLQ